MAIISLALLFPGHSNKITHVFFPLETIRITHCSFGFRGNPVDLNFEPCRVDIAYAI